MGSTAAQGLQQGLMLDWDKESPRNSDECGGEGPDAMDSHKHHLSCGLNTEVTLGCPS